MRGLNGWVWGGEVVEDPMFGAEGCRRLGWVGETNWGGLGHRIGRGDLGLEHPIDLTWTTTCDGNVVQIDC